MRRDQKPGDDEEDIDADEAARKSVRPKVVEHNASHRRCSQRLDVEAKVRVGRLRGGLVSRLKWNDSCMSHAVFLTSRVPTIGLQITRTRTKCSGTLVKVR